MRIAIIDLSTKKVANVAEVEPGDGSVTSAGFLSVTSDDANIGDAWDGAKIIKAPEPPREPRT